MEKFDKDVAYGNIDYIDEFNRFLFLRRSPPSCLLSYFSYFYNPFPQQGSIFSSKLYKSIGGFDTNYKYSADFDFFLRCSQAETDFLKYKTKSVAGFRLSPSQLSQSMRHVMRLDGRKITALYRKNKPRKIYYLRVFVTLYRIFSNIDGIYLRKIRGFNLDSKWR